MAYRLTASTGEQLRELTSALRGEFDEMSERFENAPVKFKESENGELADGWLEQLDNLLADLDNFVHDSKDYK